MSNQKREPDQYCYATDRWGENFVGGYPTREAARADAIDSAKAAQRTKIVTARAIPFGTDSFLPSAADVIGWMHESASDEAGGDHVDDWPDVSKEGEAALDQLLREWAEKHVEKPTFYGVEDEVEEEIDEEEA